MTGEQLARSAWANTQEVEFDKLSPDARANHITHAEAILGGSYVTTPFDAACKAALDGTAKQSVPTSKLAALITKKGK